MSDSDEEPLLWKASSYRSRFFRHQRDPSETQALIVSNLGPTKVKALPWSPHLLALLQGIHDPSNPLSVLRGHESAIVKKIYGTLVETWREHIVIAPPAHAVGTAIGDCGWDEGATEEDYEHPNHVYMESSRFEHPNRRPYDFVTRLGRDEKDRPEIAFSLVGQVEFPPPKDHNVNMMPFIMGQEDSLPEDLRPYYKSIIAKCPVQEEEFGKVVYLTVTEGMVEASATQRRPGLHVEAASGIGGVGGTFRAGTESSWGGGVRDFSYLADVESEVDTYNGGLYMASNMDDSCMLWDALIAKDQGITDYHGGGDHLRRFIGKGTKLKANELAWLTDRTPHQALPQAKTGYRQFFRLVTSNISVWFQQHSTPNPEVSIPEHVQIIREDKFVAASKQDKNAKKRKAAPA